MRVANFDQHVQKIREKSREYQLKQRAKQSHRPPRRRPRDAASRQDLIELSLKRREQWLKDGRLEKLGPRHYRVRL